MSANAGVGRSRSHGSASPMKRIVAQREARPAGGREAAGSSPAGPTQGIMVCDLP